MVSAGVCWKGKDKDALCRHRKNEIELRQLHETRRRTSPRMSKFVPLVTTTCTFFSRMEPHLVQVAAAVARLQTYGLSCACGTRSQRLRSIGTALKNALKGGTQAKDN
jgi:hypothetical protein